MVTRDLVAINRDTLILAEFKALSNIPPELECLANITKPKTGRAYKVDVAEFLAFSGLKDIKSLRAVARSHVIVWRKHMESRSLAPASIRRNLSALSSLFDYLCERNAVQARSASASCCPGTCLPHSKQNLQKVIVTLE